MGNVRFVRTGRRAALRGLSALSLAGVVSSARAAAPACVLSPAQTEGPFFVDERLERADLVGSATTPGLRGALPLKLSIAVVSARKGCEPLPGMQIDVWHTDALGNYSDVQGHRGQTFCRGYQTSDAQGLVQFRTIYPGWYPGRTIHIHVKARRFDPTGRRTYEFTTQLYFDEATNDAVMARAPYDSRGPRDTRNARDGLYRNATSLLARVTPAGDGPPALAASITLGLDI